MPPGPLEAALRTNARSQVYGVTAVQAVLASLEKAAGFEIQPIDLRGHGVRSAFEQAVLKGAALGGPVVVLLGAQVSNEARGALDAVLEHALVAPKAVFALTAAGAVTPQLAALFPLQLAARVLGENQ